MTLLEARSLSGGYGAADVVRDVGLAVGEGQCPEALGPRSDRSGHEGSGPSPKAR